MDVVILCAGQGNRLLPLTKLKPKSMVEVRGKPIIEHIYNSLDTIKNLENIYVITGYKFKVLETFIKTYLNSNIECIRQMEQTGTSDAVDLVRYKVSKDFLVLAGDCLYNKEDIEKLSLKNNSLLFTTYDKNLYELGTLELENDNIRKIHEKKTKPISNFVNMSAYHLDRNIFKYINLTPINEVNHERTITETINLMINDGKPFFGIYTKNWIHITYPRDIYEIDGQSN